MYKLYLKGNYVFLEILATGQKLPGFSKEVKIIPNSKQRTVYTVLNIHGWSESTPINLSELQKENGDAYTSSEFETFYTESTGNFSSASGGSGAIYTEEEKLAVATISGKLDKGAYTGGDAQTLNLAVQQAATDLLTKLPRGTYTGTAQDLYNLIINATTGVTGISVVPTDTPTGTGIASWIAVQNGTYTNFGGKVLPVNSVGVISRSAVGAFTISHTAFDFNAYALKTDLSKKWLGKSFSTIGNVVSYVGKDWYNIQATTGSDVPGASFKWMEKSQSYISTDTGVIVDESNLYQRDSLIPNLIIKLGTTYTTKPTSYYSVTGFLPIQSTRSYLYSGITTGNYTDNGCVALFSSNSDSSYITAVKVSDLPTDLKTLAASYPTAKYIKFSLRVIGENDVVTFKYKRSAYDFKALEDIVAGKANNISYYKGVKISSLGDSYTDLGCDVDRGFIYNAIKSLGMNFTTQHNNYGIGGTRIANDSFVTTDVNAMVNRFNSVVYGDILLLMGGYNDGNSPYINWSDKIGLITDLNTTTIYGAYRTIIEGRMTYNQYSRERLVLMTYPYTNANAEKILLNQTIRNLAVYYNLPIVDLERECNFIKGKNCDLNRSSILNGKTWIDGVRINYNDGVTFLTDAGWAWINEYIPVNTSLYRYINQPATCNVFQYHYNGSGYDYIGLQQGRESFLAENCTHIRVSANLSQKSLKWTIEDGELVTDGVHPNLLGFNRMAPVLENRLRSLIKKI